MAQDKGQAGINSSLEDPEKDTQTEGAPLPKRAGKMNRRQFSIHVVGGLALAGLAKSTDLTGCSTGETSPTPTSDCTVYPEQTEGPYYLDLNSLRSDITEGRPGQALTLVLTIVRASDCTPLKDLAVDIWHCDAGGLYSGYPGQLGGVNTTGQTFLRGTQVTDANGKVTFQTLYPGWYPGRTTHIHFKVHTSSNAEATSQFYFPEDVTSAVYATSPYSSHGQKDTSNNSDGIYQDGAPAVLSITTGTPYSASAVVGVAV